jgi:isopenicillin N synthase-like dioxygenase
MLVRCQQRLLHTIRLDRTCVESEARKLLVACETDGFFNLAGHSVPRSLQLDVFAKARQFFELPLATKMRYLATPQTANRGYTPSESEQLDPLSTKRGDTKEGFYIGMDREPCQGRALQGYNQYLKAHDEGVNIDAAEWNECMIRYRDELIDVARRLNRLFAVALELGDERALDKYFGDPMAFVRLLRYDRVASSEGEQLGAGAHSDYGHVTLLMTDDEPGLQIFERRAQRWVDVPKPDDEGAFIVNIGDMLQTITGGRFKSTLHRVYTPATAGGSNRRQSVAFFFDPNFDAEIVPLRANANDAEPIRPGDYLLAKYRQTYKSFAN